VAGCDLRVTPAASGRARGSTLQVKQSAENQSQ
jgi:hypothetical protein